MCRFLLLKSKNPVKPQHIIKAFSIMAKKSKAFDGDWQGDGWGFSWLDTKNRWQIYKSLKPIWRDQSSCNVFPETQMFAIHARSATFPTHKGNIEFNQPYANKSNIFVFNGYLKGVTLSIPGTIGAEKIWYLLQKMFAHKKSMHPVDALQKVKHLLKKNTRDVQALNIGFSDGRHIYALNYYAKHPEYYRLRYLKKNNLSIIASEPIDGYDFQNTVSGSILSF